MLSCNEAEFIKAKPAYEQALKKSGFNEELKFQQKPQKRKRTRNPIYFNPPFNANVKTDIGRKFLQLVRTHFPPSHKYSKIFNPNKLKMSYCCMPNIGNIIANHNAKIKSIIKTGFKIAVMSRCYSTVQA